MNTTSYIYEGRRLGIDNSSNYTRRRRNLRRRGVNACYEVPRQDFSSSIGSIAITTAIVSLVEDSPILEFSHQLVSSKDECAARIRAKMYIAASRATKLRKIQDEKKKKKRDGVTGKVRISKGEDGEGIDCTMDKKGMRRMEILEQARKDEVKEKMCQMEVLEEARKKAAEKVAEVKRLEYEDEVDYD